MVAPVTTGGHVVLRNVQSTKTQWDLEDHVSYHQWLLELTGLVRRQTDRYFLSTPRPAELGDEVTSPQQPQTRSIDSELVFWRFLEELFEPFPALA